jgi:hypothetical protein
MRCLQSTSRAAIACSLLGALACAGKLDRPERFAYLGDAGDAGPGPVASGDGGCDPVTDIFPPSCTTSACHSAQSQQGNLDLQSAGLPQRLVGKQAHGGPGLLIDPVHPAQSVLLLKVSDNPPFQFQMPLGAAPLTADEIACLTSWVDAAVTDAGP